MNAAVDIAPESARIERLRSLHAEIASLCAVKCRMSHERVVRDATTGLPAACRFPIGSFRRIGLCAADVRATRLGCSHTSARIKLTDAIDVLAVPGAARWREEARCLDNAIHLLDHRKGDAEKRLAEALERAQRSEMRAVAGEIRALEDEHDGYMERIERLKAQVLAEIQRQLCEPVSISGRVPIC